MELQPKKETSIVDAQGSRSVIKHIPDLFDLSNKLYQYITSANISEDEQGPKVPKCYMNASHFERDKPKRIKMDFVNIYFLFCFPFCFCLFSL